MLLAAARAGGGDAEVLDLAAAVQAAVARRAAIAPNVDFALATLVAAAGLPPDTGEALFALARTAGWLAHGLEEYAAPPSALPVAGPPGQRSHRYRPPRHGVHPGGRAPGSLAVARPVSPCSPTFRCSRSDLL